MANPDIPSGFKPFLGGSHGSPEIVELPLAAANAAIGIGSPITLGAAGVTHATAGTGNALSGIAAEAKAASSGGFIKVWGYRDYNQLFTAQTDNGTGTATNGLADTNLNINFVGTGVSNGLSTSELDENSATSGATVQFTIVKLAKTFHSTAQNAAGEFNRLVVRINNHTARAGVAGT